MLCRFKYPHILQDLSKFDCVTDEFEDIIDVKFTP